MTYWEAAGLDLPESGRVFVTEAGILTRRGGEELVLEPGRFQVGDAIALLSGRRLAFRRVLEIHGAELRLRADVAPFEDRWTGDVVGRVRPRLIDRLAAIDPIRFTTGAWHVAIGASRVLAARRRLAPRRKKLFTTTLLAETDWPTVREFWKRTCGRELPILAHPGGQHVIGLYAGGELVGANILLAFGSTAFSAFTLVDRRCRGLGGGGLMLARAVDETRRRGFESVYVHINARNLPSIGAYRGAGFEQKEWWSDEADPLAAAERQWLVYELDLRKG